METETIPFPIISVTQSEDKGMHVQFDKKQEFIKIKSQGNLDVYADMDLAMITMNFEEKTKQKEEDEKIETDQHGEESLGISNYIK